jgi:hypothetical protein
MNNALVGVAGRKIYFAGAETSESWPVQLTEDRPDRPTESIYCISINVSPHLLDLPTELLENILVITFHRTCCTLNMALPLPIKTRVIPRACHPF